MPILQTAVIVALLIIVPRIEPTNARRGVIIQGIYRTNLVFFLLPLAQNVFGNAALVPASMMVVSTESPAMESPASSTKSTSLA